MTVDSDETELKWRSDRETVSTSEIQSQPNQEQHVPSVPPATVLRSEHISVINYVFYTFDLDKEMNDSSPK